MVSIVKLLYHPFEDREQSYSNVIPFCSFIYHSNIANISQQIQISDMLVILPAPH